jgi:murein DD-endopeptidase MepM/ murein hydrolase activator NlpD
VCGNAKLYKYDKDFDEIFRYIKCMRDVRFHPALLMVLVLTCFLAACLGAQAPAPVTKYAPGQGAGTTGIHTVSSGETIWLISQRYNIASRDIAVVNNLQAPFYLSPGQRLKLPPPQQYKVRARDTMNAVSRLFGVSQSEIAKMNNISPPYKLRAGQVLRLPSITQKTEPDVFAQSNAMPATSLAAVAPAPVTAETLAPPPGIATSVPNAPQGHTLQLPQGYGQQQVAMGNVPPQPEAIVSKPQPKSPVTAKVPKRSSGKFMKPVSGKLLSSYGPKDNGSFNDGMNIAAAPGTSVKAAENGVVVYAGDELKGSGNLVLIRHADRWMTAYAHLGDINIRRGDVVQRGQTIGTVGSTGSVDKPQLHFEVRRGTEAINPEVYVEG